MLTHTSGVDFPDITTITGPEYVNQDIPMKEFFFKHMPTVVRPPGEAYTYDNFAFALARYAVENVMGSSFSRYMEKKIFKPLGMEPTSVRFSSDLLKRMATHYGPTDPVPTSGAWSNRCTTRKHFVHWRRHVKVHDYAATEWKVWR